MQTFYKPSSILKNFTLKMLRENAYFILIEFKTNKNINTRLYQILRNLNKVAGKTIFNDFALLSNLKKFNCAKKSSFKKKILQFS